RKRRSRMKRKVLVVDIGGTHVKLLMSSRDQREFASGPRMRPEEMIARFKETVREWKFDVASIGFPARVRKGRITKDPKHVGKTRMHSSAEHVCGKPKDIHANQNGACSSNAQDRHSMPGRGLEPLRISPPDPKSGASANFTTLAPLGFARIRRPTIKRRRT